MNTRQTFYVRGMVCQRCISIVRKELEDAGVEKAEVRLGEIITSLTALPLEFEKKLNSLGFELLVDKNLRVVNQVKDLVKEVYSGEYDFPIQFRFSQLVADRMKTDYDKVSQVFTETEGITIEKYIIDYRIDKIRELLVYTNESLSDISFKLGFSSVAHLSRQFKQQTGLNASHYKAIRNGKIAGQD
jgi:AraC family transcriptional regulator